jgi:hypothetical protein
LQTSDKYQFVEHTMSSNAFSLSKEWNPGCKHSRSLGDKHVTYICFQ